LPTSIKDIMVNTFKNSISLLVMMFFNFLLVSHIAGQTIVVDTLIGDSHDEVPNYFSINQDDEVLIACTHNGEFYQIIKADLAGNILDSVVFGEQGNVVGWDVIQCPTGDVYFVGSRVSGTVEFFRFSSDLDFISKEDFEDTNVRAVDLIISEDRMIMMLGAVNGSYVRAMNFDASMIWEYTYSNEADVEGDDFLYLTTRMVESYEGNLVVSGQQIENGSAFGNGFVYYLAGDGELKGDYVFESDFVVQYFSATELLTGDVLIAGTQVGEYNSNYATVTRLDMSGKLISHSLYQDEEENLVGLDVKSKNGLIYLLAASKGVSDIYMIVTDMEGNQIEQYIYGNFRNDTALQFELMEDNKMLIVARGVGEEPMPNGDIRFILLGDIAELSSVGESLIDESFLLFPNPIQVGGQLDFNRKLQYATIYNLEGHEIFLLGDAIGFAIPEMAEGVYFLKGLTEDGTWVNSRFLVIGK